MDLKKFTVTSGENFSLKDHETAQKGKYPSKTEAREDMKQNLADLQELQDKLWAQDRYSLLIIIQATDAAGKDGLIKHVMSGVNPQGCSVASFKQPSAEEMDHDYLWRCIKELPERGQIGIFNRSYYEDVMVVRVHDLVQNSKLPESRYSKDIWEERFEQIRNFEKYLFENGIIPVKLFLHVSKEEQKQRFLDRIEDPAKNWKFSMSDVKERAFWDQYQEVYEDAIQNTATEYAPWYILPADHKWFARLTASEIIVDQLKKMDLKYPVLSPEDQARLEEARTTLLIEK